jgi:type II secretory pathway component GspD/PulD (secretin)
MSPRLASILVATFALPSLALALRMRKIIAIMVCVAAVALSSAAWGQVTKLQSTVKHRPTFIESDFGQIAKYLGELTSRTFELDPGVCAQVTAQWDKPLTSDEFYREFLDIARALGYVVVEDGLVTKIQLAADTPKDPTPPCRRYPVRNSAQK